MQPLLLRSRCAKVLTMSTDRVRHPQLGHRERKKQLTRAALVDAAVRLFETHGYDRTTIAEIAAAAGVAPRTFFSYFATKEDVLFTDSAERLRVGTDVIAHRAADETVVDLLQRLVRDVVLSDDPGLGFTSGIAKVRVQMISSVPAVQARAVWWLFAAQAQLSGALHRAYPEELDEPAAAAFIGAFTGAIIQAVVACLRRGDGPDRIIVELQRASQIAIQGLAAPAPPPGPTGTVTARPETAETG